MNSDALTKSEQMIIAVNELSTKVRTKPITVGDVAVKCWEKWPKEFCIPGYSQYPNNDIQKHFTKLLSESLLTGGVSGYKITEKGKIFVKSLNKTESQSSDKTIPKYVEDEINRIRKSSIFKHFERTRRETQFIERDLFEFLGSSPRSFKTNDKSVFSPRFTVVVKETLPVLAKMDEEYAKVILELWGNLKESFADLIKQMEKKK